MSARRRHVGPIPHVRVKRTGPRVVSIRELKWNARLGVVSQLAYIAGRLPATLRTAAVVLLCAVLLFTAFVVGWLWRHPLVLVAAAVLLAARRFGVPAWQRWRQYRRDRDSIPF